MKLIKPKFWNSKYNFFSILLIPITLLTLIYIYFKNKLTKKIKFNIPIICVGNLYIGGTGKTPASLFLAQELKKLGKRPVIIRKYYKDHFDEYNLIKKKFNHVIVEKKRSEAIIKAQNQNYDVVILDDGFQDIKIQKDLNIICFNQNQLIGNGLVIPSGPLRESLNALKRAQIILINGKKDEQFEKKIFNINKDLLIFYSKYYPENIDNFKNKKLMAIAAIGNPENFFYLLEKNNLIINKKLIFPDHHNFTLNEFNKIILDARKNGLSIIMTEKDFYKVKDFKNMNFDYLKVSLIINDKDNFINTINRLSNEKN